jgi:hypothetical protein
VQTLQLEQHEKQEEHDDMGYEHLTFVITPHAGRIKSAEANQHTRSYTYNIKVSMQGCTRQRRLPTKMFPVAFRTIVCNTPSGLCNA